MRRHIDERTNAERLPERGERNGAYNEEGDEIYKLFVHLPNTGLPDDYNAAVATLNAHFDPQLNADYERFKLRQARRREGESMDAFHERLLELASKCTDEGQHKEVWAQMIQGCRNKNLWTLILCQPCITLEDILILARSHDLSDARSTAIEDALTQQVEKPVMVKTERADAVCNQTREPRGKQNTGTESAGEPPVTQSSSTEDPAAVPSAEPLPSTSADGDSGAASAIPAGTGGTEAPTPAAVGGEPTAAGDVTPSQKPTRKELAVRARQRKLQAIVEAYRRLVDQAEEEEEEAAAAAAASSNAPGPKPAGLRRRGQAAARRRIVTSSAAPPQQQQHACKCRCRDFKAKILRRVAKLEEERKKLEDGLEERVKIMVDKHLKARRL
ncbi:uncharacterized protein LOC144769100 [Lissotriton helveticus]